MCIIFCNGNFFTTLSRVLKGIVPKDFRLFFKKKNSVLKKQQINFQRSKKQQVVFQRSIRLEITCDISKAQ